VVDYQDLVAALTQWRAKEGLPALQSDIEVLQANPHENMVRLPTSETFDIQTDQVLALEEEEMDGMLPSVVDPPPGLNVHDTVSSSDMLSPDSFAPPDLAPPDLAPPDLAPPDLAPPDLAPPDLAPPDLAPEDFSLNANVSNETEDFALTDANVMPLHAEPLAESTAPYPDMQTSDIQTLDIQTEEVSALDVVNAEEEFEEFELDTGEHDPFAPEDGESTVIGVGQGIPPATNE